jgi:uncharacterized protein (DUF488 family)
VEIHTIGFTQKSAKEFFGLLKRAGTKRLIDVRLNNVSQLAAFAKRDDLEYFLLELLGAEYHHEPLLAPEADLLQAYRSKDIEWSEYEKRFQTLMEERSIQSTIDWDELLDRPTVLLCSEPAAENCHRRLVVEYLIDAGRDLDVVHL